MLTELHIKNFKAWRDTGSIRLAPLTVFFGGNSAGKTSIPQLLLLLKQTAESPDRQRALHLGDARTAVDLGTYKDVVHRHDLTRPLEFSLKWRLADPIVASDNLSGSKRKGTELLLEVCIDADKANQPTVVRHRYTLGDPGQQGLSVAMQRKNGPGSGKFDMEATGYDLKRQIGRAWPLPQPVRFYGYPDEATAYFQNSSFLADLVLSLESELRKVVYVGPLREYPKRLYLWSGEVPEHVGIKGERAVEALLAAGPRAFNFKKREPTRSLQAVVAETLKKMGLIDSFRLLPLGEGRKEYEVLVKTHAEMPEVRLTDVGFGVGQILPVITECFYVPAGSIVIFEQPEIHLHPKVQADLADLFVDALRAREGGTERGVQFIIESHSEHFLRRLQTRIAEEKLTPAQAGLYFVHNAGAEAKIEELNVDPYGNITNWPADFFGDEMADIVGRADAQARRMRKSGGAKK